MAIAPTNKGVFEFDCADIEKIKSRLAGIEEKRTQAFHLLLDGSAEVKKRFDETLKEYQKCKEKPEEKKTETN